MDTLRVSQMSQRMSSTLRQSEQMKTQDHLLPTVFVFASSISVTLCALGNNLLPDPIRPPCGEAFCFHLWCFLLVQASARQLSLPFPNNNALCSNSAMNQTTSWVLNRSAFIFLRMSGRDFTLPKRCGQTFLGRKQLVTCHKKALQRL